MAKLDYLTPVRLDRQQRKQVSRQPLEWQDIVERARRRARQQDQQQAFTKSFTTEKKNWVTELSKEIESFGPRQAQQTQDKKSHSCQPQKANKILSQAPPTKTDLSKQSVVQNAQLCVEKLVIMGQHSFICQHIILSSPAPREDQDGAVEPVRTAIKTFYGDDAGRQAVV